MPKRISREERARRAKRADFDPEKTGVSGKQVLRALEPGVEKGYNNTWEVWEQYNETYPNNSNIFDEKDKQNFVIYLGKTTRGRERKDDRPKPSTIWQSWKKFTAQWARQKGQKLPHNVTNSGTMFIFQELHKHVPMNLTPHKRDYLTEVHFKNILQQLWHNDWREFVAPIYRVYLSCLLKFCMYSSGRVGEYVESTARAHSGRGLRIPKGMDIIVICNSKGKPEVIIQPERDAKNMTRTEEKRPRHPMQEDIESLPLYLNPVLEPLALCLARGMFRDFDTVDEIFALEPSAGESFKLVLCPPKAPMYDSKSTCDAPVIKNSPKKGPCTSLAVNDLDTGTPLFESMSDKGPAGTMLNATWLDTELKKLGHRSGYDRSISIHDLRAEALVRADESGCSLDERMKFSGHRNPREFYDSYMPATSSVSGVSNILKLKPRKDISEHFRGLSLQRHPRLWQRLPAKLQHDFEESSEYVDLESRINELNHKIRFTTTENEARDLLNERQDLYKQKHCLLNRELASWQERLSKERKPNASQDDDNDYKLSYHWTWFGRVSHLMPERSRLSSLLLLPVPLRSPEGRQAIADMITICRQRTPVSDHPALASVNGCCPVAECGKTVSGCLASERWKHIYKCLKENLQKQHGFSSLCFVCHQWFTNKMEFELHCQYHLDNPDTFPIQYGFLQLCGMLASPGYSPRLLEDDTLPAIDRMRPFLDPQSLSREMDRHYKGLSVDKPVGCKTLHCNLQFDSIPELQYHYQDFHCIPIRKRRACFKFEAKDDRSSSLSFRERCENNMEFRISTVESFKRGRAELDSQGVSDAHIKRAKCDATGFTRSMKGNVEEHSVFENQATTDTNSGKFYPPSMDDSGHSFSTNAAENSGEKSSRAPEMTQSDYSSLDNIDPLLFERPGIHTEIIKCSINPFSCPACGEKIPAELLQKYSTGATYIPVRQQFKLCREHRMQNAKSEWARRGYPSIDWRGLDERLKKYHSHLHQAMQPGHETSYKSVLQRETLETRIRIKRREILHKFGYYGPRGDIVLLEHIMLHFGSHLHDMATTEPLVANYGPLTYAHEVLVPELLLLLIKEDLGINEADAVQIMDESTEIGDMINGEEEDEGATSERRE